MCELSTPGALSATPEPLAVSGLSGHTSGGRGAHMDAPPAFLEVEVVGQPWLVVYTFKVVSSAGAASLWSGGLGALTALGLPRCNQVPPTFPT